MNFNLLILSPAIFYYLILLIRQNANSASLANCKDYLCCRHGFPKSASTEHDHQQLGAQKTGDKIGIDSGQQNPQKIEEKKKRRRWKNILDIPRKFLKQARSRPSKKKAPKNEKEKQGNEEQLILGQISEVGTMCLPTKICPPKEGELVDLMVEMETDNSSDPTENDEEAKRNESIVELRKKLAENIKIQIQRKFVKKLKEKTEKSKQHKKYLEKMLEMRKQRKEARIVENVNEFARRWIEIQQNEKLARALDEQEQFITQLVEADAWARFDKDVQKDIEELVIAHQTFEHEERVRLEQQKREETLEILCHPNTIRLLGQSNGEEMGSSVKGMEGNDQEEKAYEGDIAKGGEKNVGEGQSDADEINDENNLNTKKEMEPENQEKKEANEETRKNALSQKNAIRFALRLYFCDHLNENKEKGNQKSGGSQWQSEGFGIEEFEENRLVDSRVNRKERWFYRNDPLYPHQYPVDFKFSVFFPAEFRQLWTNFGVNAEDLLISLTNLNLRGFDNPAKSGSWMATSWNGQFFLKAVQMEPKKLAPLEDPLEKDFFFNVDKKSRDCRFWSLDERQKSSGFKGGIASYFRYMQEIGNSENGPMETLLPKFYGLIAFQNKDDLPKLLTIQNGLFPDVLPDINYKFDLKGSSNNRLLLKEEAAKKAEPIWMDLNFIQHNINKGNKTTKPHGFFRNGIEIGEEHWKKIRKTIEADSKFLASLNIIDYSLLLGVHFVDDDMQNKEKLKNGISASCTNCAADLKTLKIPEKMQKQKSKIIQNGNGGESDSDNESEFGSRKNEEWEKRREIRIFIGIIDVLQSYNGAKKVESAFKTFGNTFSAIGKYIGGNEHLSVFPHNDDFNKGDHSPCTIIEPPKYQERFVNFLTTIVLKPEPADQSNV